MTYSSYVPIRRAALHRRKSQVRDSFFNWSVFCKTCSRTLSRSSRAVDLGQQVAELVASLQQLPQRLDLLDDVGRLEVFHRVELQLHGQFAAVALERVLDAHVQPGRHPRHDLVEVVAVDLDELAVLERLERLGRIAGEIAQHAHDEGQFFHDHGPFGFHFVGDVDPGRRTRFNFSWILSGISMVLYWVYSFVSGG